MDAHPPSFFERAIRRTFSPFFATISPILVTITLTTALVARIAIVAHYDPWTVVAQMQFHILSGR
jgi:hypothetical protein